MKTAPRAYHYVRFSTPEQAGGDSLRRQSALADQYCAEKGLTLDNSLRLRDLGVSAFRGSHRSKGALGAFLAKVRAGEIPRGSRLLFESWDRLSREGLLEQVELLVGLLRAGIILVILADGQELTEEVVCQDPFAFFGSMLKMQSGNAESKRKSRHGSAAWFGKREKLTKEGKKLTARCPAWLRMRPDRTAFEFIAERVALIRRIVNEKLAGKGVVYIANQFNREKIPAWGMDGRGGEMWHKSYIQKVCESSALVGRFQSYKKVDGKRVPVGDPVEGYFPAVIDMDQWARLQGAFHRKKFHRGRVGENLSNLFSHLTKDWDTGLPMIRLSKGDGLAYLQCATGGAGWPYHHFEKCVLSTIGHIDIAAIFASGSDLLVDEFQTRVLGLKSRIESHKAAIQRLLEVAESSKTPPKSLVERISEKELQLSVMETELQQAESSAPTTPEAIHSGLATIRELIDKSGDRDSRFQIREALRSSVNVIRVDPVLRDPMVGQLTVKPGEEAFTGFWSSFMDATQVHMQPGYKVTSRFRRFEIEFANGTKRLVYVPEHGGNAGIIEGGRQMVTKFAVPAPYGPRPEQKRNAKGQYGAVKKPKAKKLRPHSISPLDWDLDQLELAPGDALRYATFKDCWWQERFVFVPPSAPAPSRSLPLVSRGLSKSAARPTLTL
ncbi:MAG: recombinase family protein [Candidatus Methylacidiphilales bacterium]|nr:recombinase family protein [Candidatus Methylacidiphilales bacterium]